MATSDDRSSATAFSGDSSVANANGLNNAIANAVALDAASASANASNSSDALSVAINRSAAEAIADTPTGSASAAAQNRSNSTATATNSSTANALAVDLAQATAASTQDSVALAAAIECGNADANARNTGAAWAVGSLTGTPVAAADGNPVAVEASGPVTVTPAMSLLEITGDVSVTKAQTADFAMFVITNYISSGSANPALAPSIQALVTLDPPVPAPACDAKPPQAVPGLTGFTLLILIAALTFVAARTGKPTVI